MCWRLDLSEWLSRNCDMVTQHRALTYVSVLGSSSRLGWTPSATWVPPSARVSFTANLIICWCASSKNHSHQLPTFVRHALSELLISALGSMTVPCGIFWSLMSHSNGRCLLFSWSLERNTFSTQKSLWPFFPAASIQTVGGHYSQLSHKWDVCSDKCAATIAALQFFFELSPWSYIIMDSKMTI